MTLSKALDMFKDDISDILNSVSLNLHFDIQEEKRHMEEEVNIHLSTSQEREISNYVAKLRIEDLFGDRIRQVKRIAQYKNSLTTPPRKGRITDNDIARVKEYPIQDLYSGNLVRQGGVELWGLCPFHQENTPSFHINTKKNRWYCHGCSTGGDSIKFYMMQHNVSFIETIKALSR